MLCQSKPPHENSTSWQYPWTVMNQIWPCGILRLNGHLELFVTFLRLGSGYMHRSAWGTMSLGCAGPKKGVLEQAAST